LSEKSEYRHMGEGSKIAQKKRHMIFERSINGMMPIPMVVTG